MRILYIFPHPDDESFGPAGAIRQQVLDGHQVFLLTLTKGGATKQRLSLNLSIEEMGDVRVNEMQAVKKVLGLDGLTILDLPDSGLMDMDPREIEAVIAQEIQRVKPAVLVTYPVHGVSGFYDHLVCHAVVKRVYLQMKDRGASYLQRLAFFAISESANQEKDKSKFNLKVSPEERVGCRIQVSGAAHQAFLDALDCYKTYQEVIAHSNVKGIVTPEISFEIFQEQHSPPLTGLFVGLKQACI